MRGQDHWARRILELGSKQSAVHIYCKNTEMIEEKTSASVKNLKSNNEQKSTDLWCTSEYLVHVRNY